MEFIKNELVDGVTISAYTKGDKLIEGVYNHGYVRNSDGKRYRFSELKLSRIVEGGDEEAAKAVQAKVEDDINKLDPEKLKNESDDKLEKAGDEREKELKSAGMEIEDGEYKNSFVAAAKTAGVIDDANKGNINDSQALSKLIASQKELRTNRIKEMDDALLTDYYYSQLDSDYQDVPPYDDSMARNEGDDIDVEKADIQLVLANPRHLESLFKKIDSACNHYREDNVRLYVKDLYKKVLSVEVLEQENLHNIPYKDFNKERVRIDNTDFLGGLDNKPVKDKLTFVNEVLTHYRSEYPDNKASDNLLKSAASDYYNKKFGLED